jgi:hydroxyethylthiazole kinase-like uncharacterized protein yjeF
MADPAPSLPVPVVSELPRLAPRPAQMHKGQAGRVVIVAGSPGMSGAAVLAGLAALRGGAGLVRVCTPASVQPIVAASEPCLMTTGLPENGRGEVDAERALGAIGLEWADVVALGPGIGQSQGARRLVAELLTAAQQPLVIDADGLNNLAAGCAGARWWEQRSGLPTLVTPHPGEMARLRRAAGLAGELTDTDQARLQVAYEYAMLTGAVVVLKGYRTVVCGHEAAYINTTGNPGMATGGMGDVLTGLIASLAAQGLSLFDAARLGVYCHGLAADLLAKRIAPVGYLAREVADAIPAALAQACQAPMGFRS